MITGVHALIYSKDPDALRAFFRDVLGFGSVDAGGGWLIFALPPVELGIHPADESRHELYLMCDDIEATMRELSARGATFERGVVEAGFGRVAAARLPDGSELAFYEARHPTAISLHENA